MLHESQPVIGMLQEKSNREYTTEENNARGQENLGKLFKALHLIYLTKTPVYFLSKKMP